MTNDRTFSKPFLACSVAAAALLTPVAAHAAGVSAGTLIQNTATASYSNGTATVTVTATADFRVDELLDVAVASLDAGNVTLGTSNAVLTFRVTNTGNGPEAFNLTVDPALAGNDFNPTVVRIAYDSNNSNAYEAGVDVEIPAGGSTPSIAADGTLRVFVIVQLSGTPSDEDLANVRLTAEAVTGTGNPGRVFAGQGEGGVDAVVGASRADDDAQGTVIASIGSVTLAKTVHSIADEFGGEQPVPGATVTYQLVASATGTGSVSALTVTDPIPTGTTYVANSLRLDGASLTDQTGDDAGQAGSSGISVNIGALAGGASRTIRFSVTID